MLTRNLLIVLVAVLLGAAVVMPPAAAMPADGDAMPVQVTTGSAFDGSASSFLPGRIGLDGDCESPSAGGCPF